MQSWILAMKIAAESYPEKWLKKKSNGQTADCLAMAAFENKSSSSELHEARMAIRTVIPRTDWLKKLHGSIW